MSCAGACESLSRGSGPATDYRYPFPCRLALAFVRQRRTATTAQIASITPNGQAPCKKPYAEPSAQEMANARTNHGLRSSSA
jgi:hypothetical protein